MRYTLSCVRENKANENKNQILGSDINDFNDIDIIKVFDNSIIKLLGRNHTKQDVYNKMEIVKRYFSNINIDLIYAAYDDNEYMQDIYKKLNIKFYYIQDKQIKE